jgi:hypothetical protein
MALLFEVIDRQEPSTRSRIFPEVLATAECANVSRTAPAALVFDNLANSRAEGSCCIKNIVRSLLVLGCSIFGVIAVCGIASADSCAQRFGGSCRTEVFTMIVKTPGQNSLQRHYSGRRSMLKAKGRKPYSSPPVATEHIPVPRPTPIISAANETPRAIVEEGFNVFTSSDFANSALWEGLKIRQQAMGGYGE